MSADEWDHIPATKISEKLVKARKEYRCSCGDVIPAGTRYWRVFAIVDGEPWVERRCGSCL